MANNSSEVKLILDAVDRASSKIAGVTGKVSALGKAAQVGSDFVAGLGLNFAGMLNPTILAGQAVGKISDIVKSSVNETIAYAKQVRDTARALGINSTE